ncbi:MAG: T9SS type A sorting domain-containing protein [Bacteroidales bacterium]|nr:T9SS type A sorting domain-containing protein [Bacteroidales bacterium]
MKIKILLCSFLISCTANLSLSSQTLSLVKSFSSETRLEDYFMKQPKISSLPNDNASYVPDQEMKSETDYIMEVYNDDLTLYKQINISQLFGKNVYPEEIESEKQGDKRFYLSQTLFNNDDLMEFIITGEDYFAVVNEKGDFLFKEKIDSRNYIYFYVVEIGNKNYLRVSDESGNKEDYFQIGNTTSGTSAPLVKTSSYPNPAKEYILINYDLQGNRTGYISILDMNGKKVAGKKVTDNQVNCRFSTNGLTPGMYIVTVDTAGKPLSSEKILIE